MATSSFLAPIGVAWPLVQLHYPCYNKLVKIVDHPIGLLLAHVYYREDGCWIWQRSVDDKGYGRIAIKGKQWKVHRLAYTLFVGPIPQHLELDHLCRHRDCCNPEHLEPVTHRENFMRGKRRHMKINPYAKVA